MKKKVFSLLFIFLCTLVLGVRNVNAESLTWQKIGTAIGNYANERGLLGTFSDNDGDHKIILTGTNSNVEGVYIYNFIYDNGIITYNNVVEDSMLVNGNQIYGQPFDPLTFVDILFNISLDLDNPPIPAMSSSFFTNIDSAAMASKFGVTIEEKKVSSSSTSTTIVNSMTIDLSKFEEGTTTYGKDIKKAMKSDYNMFKYDMASTKIKSDDYDFGLEGITGEVKDNIYGFDCNGNLVLLVLTNDLKLYVGTFSKDDLQDVNKKLFINMQEVQNDSSSKIVKLSKIDLDDYIKKNGEKNVCNPNLGVVFENGAIKALDSGNYHEHDEYYINLSVDCVEENSKTETKDIKETTTKSEAKSETKKENVENPKTGISKPYMIGAIFVAISILSLLFLRKQKLMSK